MSPDIYACVRARSLCDPMDRSLPGSSVHGILQARILEWVARGSSPGDLPNPGIETASLTSALIGRFFTASATWDARCHHTSRKHSVIN